MLSVKASKQQKVLCTPFARKLSRGGSTRTTRGGGRRRRRHVASIRVPAGLPEEVLQEVRRRGGVAPETGGPDDRHPEREARGSDGEETHQRRRRRRRPTHTTDSSERVRYQRFDGNDARTKDTREGTNTPFVRRREEEGAVGRSVFFLMCLLSSPGLFPNQREEGDLSSARRGSDLNTSVCRRIFSFVFF